MTCGIYKIENKINGKVYIGQSINIEQRWDYHKKTIHGCSNSYNYPLYKAIRKYGLENFEFSIIEECLQEKLNNKEIYWINYYDSYNNGYNQTLGGNNAPHFQKITKEVLNNIIIDLQNSDLTEIQISKKYNVCLKTISLINVGNMWYNELLNYPLRKNFNKNRCIKCGKILSLGINQSKTFLCKECYNKEKIFSIPISREELKIKIRNKSFEEIAREYNYKSGNSIKRWCKNYNLPYTKKEINSYSNEKWELI